ncbi:hypothetical protein EMPG_11717 [Blastomyces silverae]|uniref:Uncharacterized protein n=1 Tax=Blastomyces silverae TaxID=2060906 RepID=A0A0H1BQN8_9EURO|nr:hypothetical protein EMPG_11717 [Blastomyces silverae]
MSSSRPTHAPPGATSPESHEANAFTAAQMSVLEQMFTRILDRVNASTQNNGQASNTQTAWITEHGIGIDPTKGTE